MSGAEVGQAFVVVRPNLDLFRSELIAGTNAAVAAAQASLAPLVVNSTTGARGVGQAAAAANAEVAASAAKATVSTDALAAATTSVSAASVKEAAAALAVTRALEAQRVAELALAAARTKNATATAIQAAETRATIAAGAVEVAQLRQVAVAQADAAAAAKVSAVSQAALTKEAAATAAASQARSAAAAVSAAKTAELADVEVLAGGATSAHARAALAVTTAVEAEAAANARLTVAIEAGATAQRIQTLTAQAAIATGRVRVAQLRAEEVANASSALVGTQTAKGLVSARTESNILKGSLVGLSRVTPVAVFGLGVYGTAAIAAGLAVKGAISASADFEQQINTFAAVTGASADEINKVKDAAKTLGADLSLPATSAGDAAVAMTELAKAGLSVNDTLAASKGVLQLATAANIDVGSAAQIAATQLNAFQLSGDQATRVAELLADASIAAQGEITDFASGFQQVSAVSNQVGLSIEDTTALLTELGKAGLRGADGGTSLRTALLRLVPTTKEAKKFQDALGISIDKTKSIGDQIVPLIEQYRTALADLTPVQQQQALTQIFGQDAIRAASIIFGQQAGELRRLTTQFEKQNSIQDLTDAKSKGLKGSFKNLQSQTETLGLTLGDVAKGPLTELLSGMAAGVKAANDLAAAFGNLQDLKINVPGLGFLNITKGDVKKKLKELFDDPVAEFEKAQKQAVAKVAASVTKRSVDETKRINATILRPAAGVDEDQAAAARSGAAPILTERAKRRRAAIEAAQATKKALEGAIVPVKLDQAVIDAQIRGSLQAELVADNKIVTFFKTRLSRLQKGTKAYLVVSGQLQTAKSQRDAVFSQIVNQDQFTLPASITIAGIRAGATKGLGDNLAAAQAVVSSYQQELANTKLTGEKLDALKVKLAEAQATVVGVEQQISDQAIADAEKADQIRKDRRAAQEVLRQTIVDIQNQGFQNRLSAADLTPSTNDNKRILEAQIKVIKGRQDQAEAIRKAAATGSQKQLDAKLAVKKFQGDILALRNQIKGLSSDSGGDGFTLSQLFQEAVNQFREFGSNIGPRDGVGSAQAARGKLGEIVISNIATTSPKTVADIIASKSLTEQEKTNQILRIIAGQTTGDKTPPASDRTPVPAIRRLGHHLIFSSTAKGL